MTTTNPDHYSPEVTPIAGAGRKTEIRQTKLGPEARDVEHGVSIDFHQSEELGAWTNVWIHDVESAEIVRSNDNGTPSRLDVVGRDGHRTTIYFCEPRTR